MFITKMQKKVGKAELKYVLVVPSTHDNISWSMPAGWEDTVKGKILCPKVDILVYAYININQFHYKITITNIYNNEKYI